MINTKLRLHSPVIYFSKKLIFSTDAFKEYLPLLNSTICTIKIEDYVIEIFLENIRCSLKSLSRCFDRERFDPSNAEELTAEQLKMTNEILSNRRCREDETFCKERLL